MVNGYANLAFNFGLADENQAVYIYNESQTATKLINSEKYYEAFQVNIANGRLLSTLPSNTLTPLFCQSSYCGLLHTDLVDLIVYT